MYFVFLISERPTAISTDPPASMVCAPGMKTCPFILATARGKWHVRRLAPPSHIWKPHMDVTLIGRLAIFNFQHFADAWCMNCAYPPVVLVEVTEKPSLINRESTTVARHFKSQTVVNQTQVLLHLALRFLNHLTVSIAVFIVIVVCVHPEV